jgi:hypothetical protein
MVALKSVHREIHRAFDRGQKKLTPKVAIDGRCFLGIMDRIHRPAMRRAPNLVLAKTERLEQI